MFWDRELFQQGWFELKIVFIQIKGDFLSSYIIKNKVITKRLHITPELIKPLKSAYPLESLLSVVVFGVGLLTK